MKIISTPEKPTKPTPNTSKAGLKVKTSLKASGPVLQHNEKLVRRPTQPAAKTGLKVKTSLKASGPFLQHNEKLVRR